MGAASSIPALLVQGRADGFRIADRPHRESGAEAEPRPAFTMFCALHAERNVVDLPTLSSTASAVALAQGRVATGRCEDENDRQLDPVSIFASH